VGGATDIGRVREGNEDSYLVDDPMGLVAIADGMGGHRAGEVASATALEALRASVNRGRPLREAIKDANDAVYAKSTTDAELGGMGTTLTAATLAAGNTLLVGHVGDSRAYLLRDGEFRQITTDHSRVQELVEDGRLTADEAAVHPMRNIVTRAVGVDSSVEVDVYPIQLRPGDRVLFCSDGLTDMLHDDFISTVLRREDDPTRAAKLLIDAANNAGGVDNITVVVISVTDEEPLRGDLTAAPAVVVAKAAEEAASEAAELATSEPDAAAPALDTRRERRSRSGRRGVTRVLLWTIPVLIILGIAIGAVAWYARHNYYVGASQGRVIVFKGVPGGLLWWNPTIERRSNVRVARLVPADRAAVKDEHTFSSLAGATAFVRRMGARTEGTTTTTTTTSTTSTTTTTTITTVAPAPAP
jgi:protein phosphatase